jgi:Do/DeqQ family serine protease
MSDPRFAPSFFLAAALCLSCRQAPEPSRAVAAQQPPTIPPTVSANRRTPTVVAVHNVIPSIVNIQTEATIRQQDPDPVFGFFFNQDRVYRTQSLGSGFIWTADGVIVTNAHVIEGASRITVNTSDGRQLPAKVIGVDPDSDVAVLQVTEKNLTPAPLGSSSDLMIGESVIAVGNPYGLSGSVTTGIVSATGRSVPSKERGRTYTDFIQTDASINPGNSGGPLLNIEGKVIGINTAIYANAQGIGFAIPVDRARKIVEDLRRFGEVHAAWIGAVTTTITPEEARRRGLSVTRGALVTRLFAGSPAQQAGVRGGDVITALNGAPVDSREALNTLLATAASGTDASLTLARGGSSRQVTVRPTNAPANLGLQMLRDVVGISAADDGGAILIDSIARGSQAERTGLAPGDQIVGVNGAEVGSMQELNTRLRNAAERSSIVLSVARGRYVYTLTFAMSPRSAVTDQDDEATF